MSIFSRALLILAIISSGSALAQTVEPPDDVEEVVIAQPKEYLLGDLGRDELTEQGVQIESFIINDFWANVRGGHNRGGGAIGNFNLLLTLDTEKLGLWDDGSFVFWGIGVYGRQSAFAVGDFQYTSSIDAPDIIEAYEMYYEHSFRDGAVNWLAGIHDYTLEFAILDYAYTFINSSFITPSTITQLPYSFYPTTGPGTRASIQATDAVYVLVGAYDGEPGNLTDTRAVTWEISKKGGIYSIAEVGWVQPDKELYHTKVAVGGWYDSGTFVNAYQATNTGNYGTYLLGEQEVWRENEGDPEQGLGVFFQVAQAQESKNINPWYFGSGLRCKGLFTGRDKDILGVGYAHAQMSDEYREYAGTSEKSERVWELGYRAQLTPSLALTPDVQYVIDPFVNPDLENVIVFYLRAEVTL